MSSFTSFIVTEQLLLFKVKKEVRGTSNLPKSKKKKKIGWKALRLTMVPQIQQRLLEVSLQKMDESKTHESDLLEIGDVFCTDKSQLCNGTPAKSMV